ncbi:hypothetical protein Rhe02_38610 [Rhizocola hellebori]|uniref:Mycothiol-dependent maleylpyruvate isomerase metal-binding domain-containing protein n=1 Tax=Rhizocola hellebori TaxID=1392758 RepID=A0A8J3Q991_9ACTN|nr:maleylpyruvate isomerase N-terminal domain-containing protein [Rhizocola hellebori]GIH05794.1 hypothetical protein Rhe02_38610 [Rhizocola hellebori]
MGPIRDAYLLAAASAAQLLADPAVANLWNKPSALESFTVSGLAGHLAGQVLTVPRLLKAPPPQGERVSLVDHYGKVLWIDADVDAEINVAIRQGGESNASDGAAMLAAQTNAAAAETRELLAAQPQERLVEPPAGPWALLLDDFLITRMMEISVHSDDLAYSVGIDAPALPPIVLEPVLSLLTSLAVRRHGASAVLRALTRAERAPQLINAF